MRAISASAASTSRRARRATRAARGRRPLRATASRKACSRGAGPRRCCGSRPRPRRARLTRRHGRRRLRAPRRRGVEPFRARPCASSRPSLPPARRSFSSAAEARPRGAREPLGLRGKGLVLVRHLGLLLEHFSCRRSSESTSARRNRSWSRFASFRSARSLRRRCFATPAASSMYLRRSSGLARSTSSSWPCPTTVCNARPIPVSASSLAHRAVARPDR